MPIVVEHVSHTYMAGSPFQATAIHDIDLTIHDGDFLGLMGHTGSGKTTLALHLNGLLKPTSGRVLVNGSDIHQKGNDKKKLRQEIGMVFQYPEHQLFEETVAKDVAFGPKNLGLTAEDVRERVGEALQRVGLSVDAIGERSPFDLSGGQMRRVAIAGVLAMRPKILLLDEPTAGLDPVGRTSLLSLIRALHQEGTTVVMISHSMEDLSQLATRLVVLEKGRLVMDGTPREVFSEGVRLSQMGLDVPAAVHLRDRLVARGIDVPPVTRMEELSQWLKERLGVRL